MRFDPITVQDKLDRDVVIRSAEVADAEDLIRYLKVTAGETPYLMRDPEEINMTLENEIEFIQSKIDDEREILLVATVDGKHVGNCALVSFGDYKRYAHRCVVAIALYEEYTGCGIGRMLLESVLSVAQGAGYEQAELDVMAGNDRPAVSVRLRPLLQRPPHAVSVRRQRAILEEIMLIFAHI